MNLQELRKKYKPEILAIADKYGANNVRVFGSVARGKAKKTSDIDFLVDLTKPLSFEFAALHRELSKLLNKEVDIVTKKSLNKYLKEQVLKKARPL